MIPIHKLLSRIRWDAEFGQGDFQIGYYDRVSQDVIWVGFAEVRFPDDSRHLFELRDPEGCLHRIPFHRVREVMRNGQVIWRRSAR